MRTLCMTACTAAIVGCSTALPLPVAEFGDDAAFDRAAGRFHALKRFRDFKGAQQALHAYAVLYQDEADKKRLLSQKLSETSFYSALGGAIAGIAKSPQGALVGGIGSAGSGILSERYNLTVQAANYDLAAEAMRCMDRETIPFTEAGVSGLTFTLSGRSVSADSELRDIAAQNFLLVHDRLHKLQANFVLATPDLNKLRQAGSMPQDKVSFSTKSATLTAPSALTSADQQDAMKVQTFNAQTKAYNAEQAFVQEANTQGPAQEIKAKDYRARMAVCTAPFSG